MPIDRAEVARLNGRWQERVDRADERLIAARRELFRSILSECGHEEAESFPPVSLPLGGRLLTLLPPEDDDRNLLNARLRVRVA
jgi:hypothetical protein